MDTFWKHICCYLFWGIFGNNSHLSHFFHAHKVTVEVSYVIFFGNLFINSFSGSQLTISFCYLLDIKGTLVTLWLHLSIVSIYLSSESPRKHTADHFCDGLSRAQPGKEDEHKQEWRHSMGWGREGEPMTMLLPDWVCNRRSLLLFPQPCLSCQDRWYSLNPVNPNKPSIPSSFPSFHA